MKQLYDRADVVYKCGHIYIAYLREPKSMEQIKVIRDEKRKKKCYNCSYVWRAY